MVNIREFTDGDLDGCVSLFLAVYALPPWNECWPIQNARAHLEELIHAPGFQGFVASNDQSIVGGLLGHTQHWSGGIEYVIDEIWVDPRVQGKGIGTQLLKHAEREATLLEAQDILLWTHAEAPATHFYLRNGFTEVIDRRFYRLDIKAASN